MTDYGQDIPVKYFWDTTQRQLTKTAYAALMGRALANVGMLFRPEISSYDLFDAANAELAIGTNAIEFFFFDFPSTETFEINGTTYRPCFGMFFGSNANTTGAGSSQPQNYFAFKVFARKSSRNATGDYRTYSYYRTVGTQALFGWCSGATTGDGVSYESGASHLDNSWLTNATFGGTFAYTLKNVGNIFVYLGPGGLVVQTGSGPKRTEFGSIHSFVAPFGLGRIAGRGRIPNEDTNLGRICPAFMVPMITADTEFIPLVTNRYNDTTTFAELNVWTYGAQYALQSTLEPVRLRMYNLENVEQPLYPSYNPATLRSPRIVNGTTRHVMQQPAIVPWERRGATAELYSLVDFQINSDQPRPQWNDVFTCQNFRFGDRTMPVGQFTDPLTSENWFAFYASNTNMMYAVNMVGATDVSATTIPPTATLYDTDSYSLASAGFGSTFPTAVTITNTHTTPWTATALTNEMTHVSSTTLSPTSADIVFEITPDPSDNDTTVYYLQFDAKIPRVGGSSDLAGALTVFYTDFQNAAATLISLTSSVAGANASYVTYELVIKRDYTGGNFKITFRKSHTSTSFGTLTAGIRNISIRKYSH
jgi:hypothetical protein